MHDIIVARKLPWSIRKQNKNHIGKVKWLTDSFNYTLRVNCCKIDGLTDLLYKEEMLLSCFKGQQKLVRYVRLFFICIYFYTYIWGTAWRDDQSSSYTPISLSSSLQKTLEILCDIYRGCDFEAKTSQQEPSCLSGRDSWCTLPRRTLIVTFIHLV